MAERITAEINSIWDKVDIYHGERRWLATAQTVPRRAVLFYAMHFCISEVFNGGLEQFFSNATGVLAPEAVAGFQAIGQLELASLVQGAMDALGSPYAREGRLRERQIANIPAEEYDALDERFYALYETDAGGFVAAADRYLADAASPGGG